MAVAIGTALALASVAIAAVGTGVSVASSLAQGEQAQKAANFNKAVAQNNAIASQQQAEFDAQRIRRRNVLLAGRQRAAVAKSGVDLSGSAEDVMYDSSIQGEMDAMAALYTGQVSSNRSKSQAQLDQMQGESAVETSYWNAGGSILSGAGSALNTWSNYNKENNPRFPGRGRA